MERTKKLIIQDWTYAIAFTNSRILFRLPRSLLAACFSQLSKSCIDSFILLQNSLPALPYNQLPSIMPVPKELFYFDLPAPDLERSKLFYGQVFGHQVGGGSLGGHVQNATPPFGLNPGCKDVSCTMIYLTTFDLEASIAQVQKAGGTVVKRTEFATIGQCAYCQDAGNGVHFALLQPLEALMDHAKNPKVGTNHGDLFFWSIPVEASEETKCRDFYRDVAEWKFGATGKGGGAGIDNLIGVPGGLGCGRSGDRVSFWFRVRNIQEACASVTKAGGKAGEIFNAPEGIMSECFDDQGIKIGLVEPAPGF